MKSLLLLVMVLLAGCATNTRMEPQQRDSIKAIALKASQLQVPLSVEYHQTDTMSAGAYGGIVGIAVSHAVYAPANKDRKMEGLLKARAFSQLLGKVNSAGILKSRLAEEVAQVGYPIRDNAGTALRYAMYQCLSEDTKTLQVSTVYELQNSSGKVLQGNNVRVQYQVSESWNKKKLQAVVHASIDESAKLIALDLSGGLITGSHAPDIQQTNSSTHASKVFKVQSPSSEFFTRMKYPDGVLIALAGETEELRVRSFTGQAPDCR